MKNAANAKTVAQRGRNKLVFASSANGPFRVRPRSTTFPQPQFQPEVLSHDLLLLFAPPLS